MKTALNRLNKLLHGSTGGRFKARRPKLGYVYAIPAGDLVGIRSTTDLAHEINAIRAELPSAGPGYLLALPRGIQKRVADLAEAALCAKAVGGGWFKATLEEAQAAIDAAAAACGEAPGFHTTSDAVISTQRRK